MVLERLASVREALKNPVSIFYLGGIISSVSLLISFIIFPSSVGLMCTFFITLSITPFINRLISYEEKREEELGIEEFEVMSIFERYRGIIRIYALFFAGVILSLSIIFLMLPEDIVQKMFEDQINEIKLIRGSFIGGTFGKILLNNIGVLLITFFLSLIFGAGSIFILSWNASVLATAIGLTAKALGGFKALPLAILTYFPHGSLELLAYFIGAIAGGILSVAMSKRYTTKFRIILKDSVLLMMVAVWLLVVAGAIETVSIALTK